MNKKKIAMINSQDNSFLNGERVKQITREIHKIVITSWSKNSPEWMSYKIKIEGE